MGGLLSCIANEVYDSKRREFLGRDGARWGKLAMFYFCFYFGLATFFTVSLSVMMIVTPIDRPRYSGNSSCMYARSKPLAPGLGFRPQISISENLILVDKTQSDLYVRSLHQYLSVYYWRHNLGGLNETKKFTIPDPGDCTLHDLYGFTYGRPCVLVKMNKIVDFVPQPGYKPENEKEFQSTGCQPKSNSVSIHCTGKSEVDSSPIRNITYISENGHDNNCGSLDTKWFPYRGKRNREDVYQAPYVWVQFNDVTPNVNIKVVCRLYSANVHINKELSLGLTNFEIYVKS